MKNLVKFLTIYCIFLLIVSCDSMDDAHKKYADESKRTYLGKPENLVAFSGKERVKLVWYANADPKLNTTVIYWNNRQDSIEQPFVRKQDGVQKDSVVIDKNMDGSPLVEGTYLFELVNKNERGQRSLTAKVQGVSFGETYASGLKIRPVANLLFEGFDHVKQSSTVKVIWDEAPFGSIKSKLIYKKRTTGEEVVLDVDNTETEITLTDVGNRLEHPDDVLYILSVYAPSGFIDSIETAKQKEQLVHYMASGTRVESALYAGTQTTFTFPYVNQDKILRLMSTAEGNRFYNCSRVAELSPLTISTTFSMKISGDQTVSVTGYYAAPLHTISDASSASTFNSETHILSLRYKVETVSGEYTVEETLVPKNTPYEKEVAKPFADKRVPGDAGDYAGFPLARIWDGIYGWRDNAFLSDGAGNSLTIDLQATNKLTRMIVHPYQATNGDYTFSSTANPREFEIWGIAELDESKLQDAAYWAWDDVSGTFKEDWVFLGKYEVERIDLRGWNATLQAQRGAYGHHIILPESAGPVRYIRYFHHRAPGSLNNLFYISELTFFGYEQ